MLHEATRSRAAYTTKPRGLHHEALCAVVEERGWAHDLRSAASHAPAPVTPRGLGAQAEGAAVGRVAGRGRERGRGAREDAGRGRGAAPRGNKGGEGSDEPPARRRWLLARPLLVPGEGGVSGAARAGGRGAEEGCGFAAEATPRAVRAEQNQRTPREAEPTSAWVRQTKGRRAASSAAAPPVWGGAGLQSRDARDDAASGRRRAVRGAARGEGACGERRRQETGGGACGRLHRAGRRAAQA